MDMIKGQNMGIDSGLEGEVALAREEGPSPSDTLLTCQFPSLHPERESKLGCDRRGTVTAGVGGYGRAVASPWCLGCELLPGVAGQERGRSLRQEGGMAGAGHVPLALPHGHGQGCYSSSGLGKGVGLWSVCPGTAHPGIML